MLQKDYTRIQFKWRRWQRRTPANHLRTTETTKRSVKKQQTTRHNSNARELTCNLDIFRVCRVDPLKCPSTLAMAHCRPIRFHSQPFKKNPLANRTHSKKFHSKNLIDVKSLTVQKKKKTGIFTTLKRCRLKTQWRNLAAFYQVFQRTMKIAFSYICTCRVFCVFKRIHQFLKYTTWVFRSQNNGYQSWWKNTLRDHLECSTSCINTAQWKCFIQKFSFYLLPYFALLVLLYRQRKHHFRGF